MNTPISVKAKLESALSWWELIVTNEDKQILTNLLIGHNKSYHRLSEQEILKIYKYSTT